MALAQHGYAQRLGVAEYQPVSARPADRGERNAGGAGALCHGRLAIRIDSEQIAALILAEEYLGEAGNGRPVDAGANP